MRTKDEIIAYLNECIEFCEECGKSNIETIYEDFDPLDIKQQIRNVDRVARNSARLSVFKSLKQWFLDDM